MTNSENPRTFDVIVVGGSYSGLAAAMALGRALRSVLVIDGGRPCNAQTPYSHNFITHDGQPPHEIAALAKQQVEAYRTVEFLDGVASAGRSTDDGFLVQTATGESFAARKLIFASGIRDQLPTIVGLAECWGISALHCPYCHGYEVQGKTTGILGNGDSDFEFAALIANWTRDLTLLTNGASTVTKEQSARLSDRGIGVISKHVVAVEHNDGHLQRIVYEDGTSLPLEVLYVRPKFEQHCPIPEALGCELTEEGYLKVAPTQATSVRGVFACGDNASKMRTVAHAVGTGTTAGMMANKELALDDF